jgi:tetratricopeptide (TPR) repeat protein
MHKFILILLLLTGVTSCKAQTPLSTKSKKATKAYDLAMQYMNTYQYDKALEELQKAKKEDPNFVEAYLLQATLHLELRQWAQAESSLRSPSHSIRISSCLLILTAHKHR